MSDTPTIGFNGFRPNLRQFLQDLSENNDREWFDDNRDRFERHVRAPALAFVREMAPRLAEICPQIEADDARHGGSIIEAQISRALADAPWPADLLADVASVSTDDFDLVAHSADPDTGGPRDIDDSLDLVAIAVRP